MKAKLKTLLFASGLLLGSAAIVVAATSGLKGSFDSFQQTAATTRELKLDGTNSPVELTNSFQPTISTSVTTVDGNEIPLNLVLAKANAGKFVELAPRGCLYNFGNVDGRITGISAITAVLADGSLTFRSSNNELSNGGAFLGEATSLTSGTKYVLNGSARYFQVQAGDSGAVITSLTIEYSCSGNPDEIPSGAFYNVEDFQSYTETGIGWDASHKIETATNLRSAFYSTYYGGTQDPTNGANHQIMGSSDYLTYSSNKGRNDSKCGLFKTNSGNNFRYIQSKSIAGINSVIGKGATLSVFMHGAYTSTDATTESSLDIETTIMAFYNAQFNTGGANGATVANYTIAAHSNWINYTVNLDPTKEYYAFGVYFKKISSGSAYIPIDDVSIYTTNPYPPVSVSGVSLSESSATLTIGDTRQLIATVSPLDADNKAVTWSSSNTGVATVDENGLVTAVAVGEATITVTTNDGNHSATCAITVEKVYPGGTYFTTLKISSYNIPVQIVLSTRTEVHVWLYGLPVETSVMTEYTESTGHFTIDTGSSTVTILGSNYTIGDITGYYRNNQLEEVHMSGTIKNLVSGYYTIPHPTSNYWDCNGTTEQLQTTFKRRYWDGSQWQVDASNSNRVVADTKYFASPTSGARLRGYSKGAAINLNSDINIKVNTIGVWIYNPSQAAITFKIWMYKSANFGSNISLSDAVVPAQSWKYYRMGFGTQIGSNSVYNFGITTHSAGTDSAFVVDDIILH